MSTIELNNNLHILSESLNAFAYSLTKNSDDARDLFQETAFRAIYNKDKFKPDTNFKAWTFTIMKNIFINNYRKKVKSNTIIDQTENSYYIDSRPEKVINDGTRSILMNELQKMIDTLDDNVRIPFLMHHEGYKYHEIATHFNLPLGTIKSRIFFARKSLKDLLKKNYGDIYLIKSMIA